MPTGTRALQWKPSPEQRHAAELLAQGYSQNRIGAILDIPVQTINSWLHQVSFAPQFLELVADIEATLSECDITDKTIQTAELVYHQAVTGERPLDDDAVIAARDILAATRWRQKAGESWRRFGT